MCALRVNELTGLWGPAAPLGPVVASLVPRCALLPAPTPRLRRAARVSASFRAIPHSDQTVSLRKRVAISAGRFVVRAGRGGRADRRWFVRSARRDAELAEADG